MEVQRQYMENPEKLAKLAEAGKSINIGEIIKELFKDHAVVQFLHRAIGSLLFLCAIFIAIHAAIFKKDYRFTTYCMVTMVFENCTL